MNAPILANLRLELLYQEQSFLTITLALTAILGGFIGARILGNVLSRIADRLAASDRSIFALLAQSLRQSLPILVRIVGIWGTMAALQIFAIYPSTASTVGKVLLVFGIARVFFGLCTVFERWFIYVLKSQGDGLDEALAALLRRILQTLVLLFAGFEIYSAISGQPPSAIIASLGVGGLAVGLAAQDSIKHFFGSLVILGDKPFAIGERIIVGEFDGVVEDIGLRSTRVRLLDGQVVNMPNDYLTNQPVRNVTKRPNIRRIINLALTYDTPPEKIIEARQIVLELLDNHDGMDPALPPKVYFNDFGPAHLNLFVIYWFHPADWWAYNDMSQQFNLEVLRRFNEAGISFAFPTQTLFLANDPKNPVSGFGAQGGT